MAIKNMDQSVDIIASLPDSPSSPQYTAQSLKEKFDESANIIKGYINGSLIPDIKSELAETVLGDGGYKYIPVKKLIASYKTAGEYTFSTEKNSSCNGLYDVVTVGAGGGGYSGDISTGGGGGDAVRVENIEMNGEYSVTVGAGGETGKSGGMSFVCSSEGEYICVAVGGGASTQYTKIGKGSGINGTDSFYGDGSVSYGRGGDCIGYGKGAVGGALRDDVTNPKGNGGGGWGEVSGGDGAVCIYGYVRGNE